LSRHRGSDGAAVIGALLLAGLGLLGPAFAQDTPYVPDDWRYGRPEDRGTLRICVDPRDPEWKIAEEIAGEIAAALLLMPAELVIPDQRVTATWDSLYHHLLRDCDVYFGFKLIPGGYPDWLALSRSYYSASYVLAVEDPGWQSLADVPTDRPIATAIGTSADFSLTKYVQTQPAGARWIRFPMGTNETAMAALENGTAAAALVWGPAAWAIEQADPAYSDVRLIPIAPLPETSLGVGAALLAKQSFLRASVDQAIGDLVADGTIAAILERHEFPAQAGP
jgi:polar amino acid transport system substrate-binding protein